MESDNILILGIGNLLWADEGFGVRAVESLNQNYAFPPHVTLLDGGTQGLNLLHHVADADSLIIFDAVDFDMAPGSLKTAQNEQVPRFLGAKKMSLHQTGFQEVLATLELMGQSPARTLLIGVQPEQLEDYGGSLTPLVREKLFEAIDICIAYLNHHGIFPTKRHSPLEQDHKLIQPELDLQRYEQQRPSNAEACRTGDSRFFHLRSPTNTMKKPN